MIDTPRQLHVPLLCSVGPTASGKTALAQAVAERLKGVVLSADSMQVYRGMDIGTSKIEPEQRTVPYYGLDIASPQEAYSASRFQDYARAVINDLDTQKTPCVICGGTGFYVRAVIDDFVFPPGEQVGNEIRDYYMHMAQQQGPQAVLDALNSLDPDSAAVIPVNDVRRAVRALEMHQEGTSYAHQKEEFAHIEAFYTPICMIGLAVDSDILRARIDARVEAMIEEDLVLEVQSLIDQGFHDALTAKVAIGYKDIIDVIDGKIALPEAVEHMKVATHRYAKRQRTWFKKDARIQWLNANQIEDQACLNKLVDSVVDMYSCACESTACKGASHGTE